MDKYTVTIVIYIYVVAMVIVIATILMVAMVNLDYVACVIVAMVTYIYLMLHFCVDYMVTRIWRFYIFKLFENFLITHGN